MGQKCATDCAHSLGEGNAQVYGYQKAGFTEPCRPLPTTMTSWERVHTVRIQGPISLRVSVRAFPATPVLRPAFSLRPHASFSTQGPAPRLLLLRRKVTPLPRPFLLPNSHPPCAVLTVRVRAHQVFLYTSPSCSKSQWSLEHLSTVHGPPHDPAPPCGSPSASFTSALPVIK